MIPRKRQHVTSFLLRHGRAYSARKVLVEAAWTYRHSAGVGIQHQQRQRGLPEQVREIAWKAQTRLCARYRRLKRRGAFPTKSPHPSALSDVAGDRAIRRPTAKGAHRQCQPPRRRGASVTAAPTGKGFLLQAFQIAVS